MKHHKKISEKKHFLRWLVFVAVLVVVFFQVFSLKQQYKYLSEIFNTMLNDKFKQSVEQYRTLKLKNLENTFSVEYNPKNESNSEVDVKIDYKNDKLSFDELMYKVTGHAIAGETLKIDELDSIFNAILLEENIKTDYKIVVYKTKTDTIIAQTSKLELAENLHFAHRKELDARRDAQVFFSNPAQLIFRKMLVYIIISGVMLVAVVLSLIFQLRIISKQKKIEKIRQDFTDSMVHELRNPLQSALSMAELAGNETFSQNAERRDEVIDRVKSNLNRLSELLTSLLERSFSENIQQKANIETGNLVEHINEIVENTSISARNPIYFNTSYSPEISKIAYDQLHLPNAIKNLVENAVKYSNNAAKIEIVTAVVDKSLHIAVKDNGLGISKEDLPYIFTKFYRGNYEQKKHGFGLGLSYVKWVAELHNGTVVVSSKVGEGSEFVIIIPLKTG